MLALPGPPRNQARHHGDDADDDRRQDGCPEEGIDSEVHGGVKVLSHAVRYSIAALITMVNKPSVRMVTGRDNSLTSGRTKAFTTPKIRPMNRYARMMPAVSAPPA